MGGEHYMSVQQLRNVRVVTLNLWGQNGAWAERRSVLIDGMRTLRPDLVAFQETIKTDEYDPVIDLLGSGFHIAHQVGRDADGLGISIASRWPLAEVHEVDLNVTPRTADFVCTTLVAKILAPDPIGPLLFVNHFPNWQLNFEYERELQAVAAARFIENEEIVGQQAMGQKGLHVVVAGDFDADPNAASVRFWSGRQSLGGMSVCYRDAWESAHGDNPAGGHTFTPRNPLVADWDWPFRRIDYIFVRCGEHGGPTLAIASCERIFDEPINGVWASDHFGLVADLALPDATD
jgi:endonuclease/exonuclease/phosphatase family metal-dependent hydrolase